MRPLRFQAFLADTAAAVPGITAVRTFADAGHTAHPYGLITQLETGGSVWWQVIGASAPGDRYTADEPAPVTGERPAQLTAPTLQPGQRGVPVTDVEMALAAGLTAADTAGEIATVTRYSTQEPQPAVKYGLSVDFHDGSRIFVNALATLRQGESDPGRRLYQADATV